MTPSLLILTPLLVLAVVLLFPFVGCVGDDALQQAEQQGKADQKTIDDNAAAAATTKQQQDEQKQAADAATAAQYDHVVLAEPDLVSYWRLSEGGGGDTTAKDSAPYLPKDGQYVGVVSRVAKGALFATQPDDTCAEFTGAGGYVEVPHDGLLNPPQEFSIELWLRPVPPVADNQVVLSNGELDAASGAVVRGFVIDVFAGPAGDLRVRGRVGHTTGFTAIESSLGDGSEHDGWRHVVMTYSVATKTLMLYVNSDLGAPRATLPSATATAPIFYVANVASPLRIAAGSVDQPVPGPAPARFFAGRVDEVALYRTPLSGAAVETHFRRATALMP